MNLRQIKSEMGKILANLPWLADDGASEDIERFRLRGKEQIKQEGWLSINNIHRRVLESVTRHPFRSVSEHAEAVGIGSWTMNRVVQELEKVGYLAPALEYSLGKRGSPRRYLQTSEKGLSFIGVPKSEARIPGKGSFQHALYAHYVCRYLSANGKSALLESNWGGKSIDVLELCDDGSVKAYEIECHCQNHVVTNIKKDIQVGCAEVVIVATDRAMQKKLTAYVQTHLESDYLGLVSFRSIADFVP